MWCNTDESLQPLFQQPQFFLFYFSTQKARNENIVVAVVNKKREECMMAPIKNECIFIKKKFFSWVRNLGGIISTTN